jgi:hypothetical protein
MMLRLRLGTAFLVLLALAPWPARAAHHGEFESPFLRIVQDSDGGKLLLDRTATAVTSGRAAS